MAALDNTYMSEFELKSRAITMLNGRGVDLG